MSRFRVPTRVDPDGPSITTTRPIAQPIGLAGPNALNPASRVELEVLPKTTSVASKTSKVARNIKIFGISIFAFVLGLAVLPRIASGEGLAPAVSDALGVPQVVKSLLWPAVIVLGILVVLWLMSSFGGSGGSGGFGIGRGGRGMIIV